MPSWSAHDLTAILDHLLATRVAKELLPDARKPLSGGAPTPKHPTRKAESWTFEDALARKDVSRDLLIRIKDYAKRAMDSGDALPREAGKALYTAVIGHAKACGHQQISSLSAASLERLARWCLAQSWVPLAIRTAVREGVNVA